MTIRLLLAASAALAAIPASAAATWPGKPGRITYGIFHNGGYRLDSVDTHGRHHRVVAAGGQDPAWSRGGGRIAFVENGRLERMHADHTHRAVVVQSQDVGHVDPVAPSWAPNAGRLAFHTVTDVGCNNDDDDSACHEEWRVYVVGRHGAHLHQVARGHDAVWSRRGRYLLYAQENGDVARIKPNGTGHRVLVRHKGYTTGLDLSPDGRRLVYENAGWIRTFDLVTGRRTRFRSKAGTKVNAVDQVWTPDGRRIAFVHWTGGPVDQVRTVRPDGKHVRKLFTVPRAGDPLPLTLSWRTH